MYLIRTLCCKSILYSCILHITLAWHTFQHFAVLTCFFFPYVIIVFAYVFFLICCEFILLCQGKRSVTKLSGKYMLFIIYVLFCLLNNSFMSLHFVFLPRHFPGFAHKWRRLIKYSGHVKTETIKVKIYSKIMSQRYFTARVRSDYLITS